MLFYTFKAIDDVNFAFLLLFFPRLGLFLANSTRLSVTTCHYQQKSSTWIFCIAPDGRHSAAAASRRFGCAGDCISGFGVGAGGKPRQPARRGGLEESQGN